MKVKKVFTKKLIGLILLLVFSAQSLFCSELFSLNAYTGLTQLEEKLTLLEDNSLKQMEQIKLLEGNLKIAQDDLKIAKVDLSNAISYSKSLEIQLDEALQQCETVSNSLKNKDIILGAYRTTLMVAIPVTFTIGLIVGLKMKG